MFQLWDHCQVLALDEDKVCRDHAFWGCLITQDIGYRSSYIARQQKQTSKYSPILTNYLTVSWIVRGILINLRSTFSFISQYTSLSLACLPFS